MAHGTNAPAGHTWSDISARQVWIAKEVGGLFAGALGAFYFK